MYNQGIYSVSLKDWKEPDWEKCDKAHDWKNYVHPDVQEEGMYFNLHQRAVLATSFQQMADNEDWD